ncbi:S24 family peptidase [Shewanella mangrovisoli]|uniref:S24 family peptidase n=1 Tax=Shewanella mangrovisoli TaxID=2864211 RepID=UPI0035BAD472
MMNERIKERRKELGLTQLQVASDIGVTKATISLWEKGDTSPKGENLMSLAKVLKVSAKYLVFGEISYLETLPSAEVEADILASAYHAEQKMIEWDKNTQLYENEVKIPFFQSIELGKEVTSYDLIELASTCQRFQLSELNEKGVNSLAAICLKVDGNSMVPVLTHGSIIGVDASATEVIDGKMYAINHEGMIRVRLLYKLPRGGLRLRSYNLDEYPDEHFNADQLEHVKVIGKVFWYSVFLD